MGNFSEIGGVPVMGFISPFHEGDEYAVTDPLYAVGGFRIIDGGLLDLNLIPEPRRRAGMVVGINNGEKYYKLLNTEWTYTINDWVVWEVGSDSDDTTDFDYGGTHINGSRLFSNRVMQVTTEQNVLNVSMVDGNILVNLRCTEDYNIILPSLDSVSLGFKVTFKNLYLDGLKGVIYPYSDDLVEGSGNFEFFGKGMFEVTKMVSEVSGDSEWVLTQYSNIIERRFQGKTKKFEFVNESIITVNHTLGYTPIVQVWLDDGFGGYSDIDVHVSHDFLNNGSFSIDLTNPTTGFILYI